MYTVNVTVGCKNCCVVSKMNKTHLICEFMHVIDMQKKSTGLNTDLCETPDVMFDIEEQQFLTETYYFLLLK